MRKGSQHDHHQHTVRILSRQLTVHSSFNIKHVHQILIITSCVYTSQIVYSSLVRSDTWQFNWQKGKKNAKRKRGCGFPKKADKTSRATCRPIPPWTLNDTLQFINSYHLRSKKRPDSSLGLSFFFFGRSICVQIDLLTQSFKIQCSADIHYSPFPTCLLWYGWAWTISEKTVAWGWLLSCNSSLPACGESTSMVYFKQQQFPIMNQPLKELSALIICSYTLMPLRNTLSSRNCEFKTSLSLSITLYPRINKSKPRLITSLLSWSNIGVFVIGENPRAGMPNCLMKRESVVEDKISGLASFPPADMIACSNTDHQGFDALVGVTMGRPAKSRVGPFCISCAR